MPHHDINAITDTLDETYGPFVLTPNEDPLGELISTILSQHTSDINTARAYGSLLATFPTWDDVVHAPTDRVIEAIRTGGLANSKAPRIQAVLREIDEREGDYRLPDLRAMPLAEAKAWLTSLPGVGPKTAACVLLFALGMPAMPVDTHVHRLALRIGLAPARMSAERTEDVLEELLGDNAERIYACHRGLIAHGRAICIARNPRCSACLLRKSCDYYRELHA